jgi:hypothetical protein
MNSHLGPELAADERSRQHQVQEAGHLEHHRRYFLSSLPPVRQDRPESADGHRHHAAQQPVKHHEREYAE